MSRYQSQHGKNKSNLHLNQTFFFRSSYIHKSLYVQIKLLNFICTYERVFDPIESHVCMYNSHIKINKLFMLIMQERKNREDESKFKQR